jgi:hypothetical protein
LTSVEAPRSKRSCHPFERQRPRPAGSGLPAGRGRDRAILPSCFGDRSRFSSCRASPAEAEPTPCPMPIALPLRGPATPLRRVTRRPLRPLRAPRARGPTPPFPTPVLLGVGRHRGHHAARRGMRPHVPFGRDDARVRLVRELILDGRSAAFQAHTRCDIVTRVPIGQDADVPTIAQTTRDVVTGAILARRIWNDGAARNGWTHQLATRVEYGATRNHGPAGRADAGALIRRLVGRPDASAVHGA